MRSSNIYREDVFGRHRLVRWAIAGLVGICFSVSASALDPTRTVSQYLHDSWGSERGLSGESITSIAQTSDGYLWIGTDKGLLRFDGFNFQQFKRSRAENFQVGPVRTLLVDAGDNLWILLQDTQVFRYHNGNLELIIGWSEHGTTAMTRGPSGAILFSSLAVGTTTYSDNRFRTLSSAALLADAARVANSKAPDRQATPFSWFDRLEALAAVVNSMALTDDGKIWLGTESRGLFYLQEGRVSSASNGWVDSKINCLLPLQNSELWVGTTKGVLRWNGTKLTSAGVPSALLSIEVLSILRDRDSNIWVGTNRGLFRYNASGASLLSTYESTGPMAALFEDREGNIWIGSARGLEQLRDSAFVTYSLPNLKSQSMGAVHVDSSDRTWIAPIEGGLRWLKGEKSEVVASDGIAKDVVYSIISSGKDDVWLGRQHGGLTHLRYSGNSFTAKTYTQTDGLAQNSVYALYRSRDGNVWAGTLSHGVSQLKNGHFTNYTTADGLVANTISSIAEDADGTMWFGTPSGLSALTKNGWKSYTVSEGLPSQDVNCLLEDSNGVLWIGTAEGLAFFSGGHLLVPKVPDSMHEPIFGIAEDKKGGLWVATAGHVLQVKLASLLGNDLSNTNIRDYGPSDGLFSTEGVKRSQSVVVDSQGRIWFSTNRGLFVVNASHVTANSFPALVHIEGVSVDGNQVDPHGPIRFTAGDHRVTFHYVGLSLGNSDGVCYRYMLENFDQGWSQPVTTREATYGSLGAGTYRFRVMASNGEGVWDTSDAVVDFKVEPRVWQTWWFRTSSAALVLLLVWFLYRYRLHQLAKEFNIRLEERVGERTRVARELHDTLLQSLQGLLLRFQTASNLLPTSPQEAKKKLDNAIDLTAEAITEGREAVQGLRDSTTLANDLAAALSTLAGDLATQETRNRPVFALDIEGKPRDLHPILRDEIYRIAGEALRNAFRHAEAHRIEVKIHYDARELRLRIRDDGAGIPEEVVGGDFPAGHFGLRGMLERANLIGGHLEILSKVKFGTEIQLTIAASAAYTKSSTQSGFFLVKEQA